MTNQRTGTCQAEVRIWDLISGSRRRRSSSSRFACRATSSGIINGRPHDSNAR